MIVTRGIAGSWDNDRNDNTLGARSQQAEDNKSVLSPGGTKEEARGQPKTQKHKKQTNIQFFRFHNIYIKNSRFFYKNCWLTS